MSSSSKTLEHSPEGDGGKMRIRGSEVKGSLVVVVLLINTVNESWIFRWGLFFRNWTDLSSGRARSLARWMREKA